MLPDSHPFPALPVHAILISSKPLLNGSDIVILDSFDRQGEPVISPAAFFGDQRRICDTAIATFSREIYASVLDAFPSEQIGELSACNRVRPIHLITSDGMQIAFYLSEIGATLSATDLIEVNWKTGASHFIAFGSAGLLNREAAEGKYVIPTEAYRDEGMSYHYAPPADYIAIRNAAFLEDLFRSLRLPFVSGRVWTTDALYRETREMVRRRKSEGCLAVEMELAGMQAVCDFHGFQLYHFVQTGDVVDQADYTPDGLQEANHAMDKFHIALKIAEKILRQDTARM